MFQVLVAQSTHPLRVDSCIHQGMEIHFVFNTLDCLNQLGKEKYDALVLQLEVNISAGVEVATILKTACRKEVSVFCVSDQLDNDAMNLLFDHKISHYFLHPYSFHDVFTKLNELKGNRENRAIGKKAAELLHVLGIPTSVQGYTYLLDSIVNCCYHEDYLRGVTKHLYPMLANEYKTTASAVEKSIRHAIEMAFSHSDQTYLYDFFKGTIRSDKAKATNSQFISMCVEYIKIEGL